MLTPAVQSVRATLLESGFSLLSCAGPWPGRSSASALALLSRLQRGIAPKLKIDIKHPQISLQQSIYTEDLFYVV